jgi:hypothetical protein
VKIPSADKNKGADRQAFVHDVMERCLATREERCSSYRTLKQYYMYGREASADYAQNVFGTVNKIFSHLDQVVSFLYSQDTTKFSVEIGKSVSELELLKLPALNEAVNDVWHSSNTDIRFGDALLWSLVYGSMFIKPRWWIDRIIPDVVEPHNIGVLREDIAGLENQEAFVHCYLIPKSQLEYQLALANHPDVQGIVDEAIANHEQPESTSQPIDSITTSTAIPVVQGEVNVAIGPRLTYTARLSTPMVRQYELYIFDDEIHDFRVFTVAHPFVSIYDREMDRMFVKNESPIVQVCPYPMHDYFFGISLVERLIGLQQMRNQRWDQVQHMMEMQARPSSFASGQFGTVDEVQDALDSPNGLVLGEQGTELKKLDVVIPDDLFAEITYLDSQFDEQDGTTPVMSGKGEQGVRSEGHASQLLRVGASRAKRRALIVEDSLEEVATLFLKIMQKYSDAEYRAEPGEGEQDGQVFVASQFTDNFLVKVDAHSNSPLFMQDLTQMAFALFKAQAIDREELIDAIAFPMKDLLKYKLKHKIEPAEAKAAQEQKQLELATGKVAPIRGKGK